MRITTRLIVSLAAVVSAVALGSAFLQVRSERSAQENELRRRSALLAESLQEAIESRLQAGDRAELQRLVDKFGQRDRISGLAVYDADGQPLAVTAGLETSPGTAPGAVRDALAKGIDVSNFDRVGEHEAHVCVFPLQTPGGSLGALAIFHDASFVQAQLDEIWLRTFLRALVQTILIAVVTLLVVRWSIVGPIARLAEWMKGVRAGGELPLDGLPKGALFAPLAREAETFARHLSRARAAAEEEARLRRTAEAVWTPERLGEHVRSALRGKPLIVVSNREPYMHLRRGRKVECIVPAGGLVTALDPVLRASGGTWIAHGAGDADFEMADLDGHVRVPPEDPHYTLKRVALTKDEEHGYYYGFSNEGLWPLCHIAHTRPTFRPEDWVHYCRANQKFARATLDEIEAFEQPVVVAQDYHLALLPRFLKEERPDARVALFWHIPWPNPESFGICPWQREILLGMLGADLIGFHTQYHCNNFLQTVDRVLESRIDWTRFTIEKDGHATLVKPFPISVAFPDAFPDVPEGQVPDRATLLRDLGVSATHLAIGVERMDYTKGVLERFRAVERLLETHTRYRGSFTLVQIGAPSRTHIKRYHDFLAEVEAEAERINWRFQEGDWKPIVFLKKHHSHREILPLYRAADVCLVTSLHDGMNLVAKEFVAARGDDDGALVLSRFAGAALELREALIVNPYDVEELAETLRYALEMPPDERRSRMRRMRETVRENNIYRWAGTLIGTLAQVPMESLQPSDSV